MATRRLFVLSALGSLGSVAAASSSAHAYCRTTTAEQQASSCPEACVTTGLPLYWPKADLNYTYNRNGFPGISDTNLRNLIGLSFGAWEEVRCGEESVGLNLMPKKDPTSLTVGPEGDEPNDNVISHFTAEEWAAAGLSAQAFALTAIWYDKNTGHILGADMHFNGGMDPYGVCPDGGCSIDDNLTDLRNVATHEAGHFLGLAHSDVESSTMWCDAMGGDVNKRSLSPDDAAGLCAIYPPGKAFGADDPRNNETTGSCSLAPAPRAGGRGWLLGLLAPLALLWRGRRRR